MNKHKLIIFTILSLFFIINFSSALNVDSVIVDTVSPGEEGVIRINVQNDGNNDVDLVSFSLEFNQAGIIPIGSSEGFVNRIKEDDDEIFAFRFRVSNDIHAGTYSIPYTLKYEDGGDQKTQTGRIGIVVSADPDIEVFADSQNSIIGQQGTLNLRVVNKGLADARFVNLFIESEDVTFLSENSEYIGTIDSDDFETNNFDVIYNTKFPSISVRITYKDFDNNDREILDTLSLRAYTQDEAVEKGILKKNNAPTYVGIIVLLFIIWFIYRAIRKRRKRKE
jgi:hypothetical protein